MLNPISVLLCEPAFFDVLYEGNIYMKHLPKIDLENALFQWTSLKMIYEKLGFVIKNIPGVPGLEDMVFTANQSFPFINKKNEKCVILSKMRNPQRKGEVELFKQYYASLNYKVYELSEAAVYFESMGDALIDYKNDRIFGGYGFRTNENVYDEISSITGLETIKLKLVSEKFYHLDTCMSILNSEAAIICREGFDKSSLERIYNCFKKVYEVSEEDNIKAFLCNCHCPDGKNIIVQKNDNELFKNILSRDFNIIETDTSEFMKSGGSVFCMKMMMW